MASLGKAARDAVIGCAKRSILPDLHGEFMDGPPRAGLPDAADFRNQHCHRFVLLSDGMARAQ